MTQNIKRVPKGDPSSKGGEFAAHKRSDADQVVDLMGEPSQAIEDVYSDKSLMLRVADRGQGLTGEDITVSQIVTIVEDSKRRSDAFESEFGAPGSRVHENLSYAAIGAELQRKYDAARSSGLVADVPVSVTADKFGIRAAIEMKSIDDAYIDLANGSEQSYAYESVASAIDAIVAPHEEYVGQVDVDVYVETDAERDGDFETVSDERQRVNDAVAISMGKYNARRGGVSEEDYFSGDPKSLRDEASAVRDAVRARSEASRLGMSTVEYLNYSEAEFDADDTGDVRTLATRARLANVNSKSPLPLVDENVSDYELTQRADAIEAYRRARGEV